MTASTSRDPIPTRALRASFIWLSHRKALGRLSTRVPITRPMVRRFIAGESLPEVLPSLERLRDAGYLTTVDVLGESVDSADACGLAAGRYEETLDAIAARGLERNVSLKLTQMGLDIDRDLCRDMVARVFRRAAEVGAFVRIDMEDHTRTDRTRRAESSSRPRSTGHRPTSRRSSPKAPASVSARAPTTSRSPSPCVSASRSARPTRPRPGA
jgi:proline dehydrogenase